MRGKFENIRANIGLQRSNWYQINEEKFPIAPKASLKNKQGPDVEKVAYNWIHSRLFLELDLDGSWSLDNKIEVSQEIGDTGRY